jgi:hypothetical protein
MTIITMPGMKKPKRREEFKRGFDDAKKGRPQVSSFPELRYEMRRILPILTNEMEIGGRSVTIGPFLAAIVVHFLDLSQEEQAEVLEAGKKHIDHLFRFKEPLKSWTKHRKRPPSGGEGAQDEGSEETGAIVEAIEAPAPPGRKRDGRTGA